MSKVITMADIVVQSLAWFGGFVFFVMRLDKFRIADKDELSSDT